MPVSQQNSSIQPPCSDPFRFVKKREICRLTGLSGDTLKKYRLSGRLSENIHWIRLNPKVVLYNAPLVMDWLQNIHDPATHLKAIEAYHASLASSTPPKRKGKAR
jgi:hypothetical protein